VTDTFPEYKPHATIAYVKKGRGAKYAGDDFLQGKTITLDSVTFSGRDGERVEIPLTGKPESTGSTSSIAQRAKPKFVTDAEDRLRQASTGRLAGSGGQQLADTAIVAGWKVYEAGMDFAQWSAGVLKQAGERVKPHLRALPGTRYKPTTSRWSGSLRLRGKPRLVSHCGPTFARSLRPTSARER
jgi:hypothetical protein